MSFERFIIIFDLYNSTWLFNIRHTQHGGFICKVTHDIFVVSNTITSNLYETRNFLPLLFNPQ